MDFVNERLQKKQELEERTRKFAVGVFQMLRTLPNDIAARVIGFQLGKSASSIGANYREANRAESRADFAHKLGIVLKEASETAYWLSLLVELYPGVEALPHLAAEVEEFLRLFQSAVSSLRKTD